MVGEWLSGWCCSVLIDCVLYYMASSQRDTLFTARNIPQLNVLQTLLKQGLFIYNLHLNIVFRWSQQMTFVSVFVLVRWYACSVDIVTSGGPSVTFTYEKIAVFF
jgi:hypothetical protein